MKSVLVRNPYAFQTSFNPKSFNTQVFIKRKSCQWCPNAKQGPSEVQFEEKEDESLTKALDGKLENGQGNNGNTVVPRNKAPVRLWSRLGADMKHEEGSVFGAAALVAGTTVGAGILALPAVTEVRFRQGPLNCDSQTCHRPCLELAFTGSISTAL